MESSQLLFEKENGNITAAGYRIDNLMMQQGQPASVLSGGSGADIIQTLKLGGLAVPLGLFYLQDLVKKSAGSFNTSVFELYDDDTSSVELVEDTLYDKLLSMVSEETPIKKNKITRKKRVLSGAAKKTRSRKC